MKSEKRCQMYFPGFMRASAIPSKRTSRDSPVSENSSNRPNGYVLPLKVDMSLVLF
jgi:hypothetical protein